MKVAIATSSNQLKAKVDAHFGRCDWYCIYDTEIKRVDFVENETRKKEEKAGVGAVSLLQTLGVEVFVAGRFGSKVVEACRINNIQLIVPEDLRSIEEIINQIN